MLRAFQVGNGSISGTALTTIYTVPSGYRLILKHVVLLNASASICDVQLRVGSAGTVWRAHLLAYGNAGDAASLYFWIVVDAGQTVQLQRSNAGQYTYSISGSLHTI